MKYTKCTTYLIHGVTLATAFCLSILAYEVSRKLYWQILSMASIAMLSMCLLLSLTEDN